MAAKLRKFKKLRTFNLEKNQKIDLTGDAYIEVIESLPSSLEMFNNQRKHYLLKEIEELLIEKKRQQFAAHHKDSLHEAASVEFEADPDSPRQKDKDCSPEEIKARRIERKLQEYEQKLAHKFRKRNLEEDSDVEREEEEPEDPAGADGEDQGGEVQGPEILLPTLATLTFNLEQATNYPSKALIYLKKIYQDSEILLKMQKTAAQQEDFDRAFTRGFYEDDVGDKIDQVAVDESVDQFLQFA